MMVWELAVTLLLPQLVQKLVVARWCTGVRVSSGMSGTLAMDTGHPLLLCAPSRLHFVEPENYTGFTFRGAYMACEEVEGSSGPSVAGEVSLHLTSEFSRCDMASSTQLSLEKVLTS